MTVTTATARPTTSTPVTGGGATLARVVRSEWTKFWSLRSTLWTLLITAVVTVGFSALFSWAYVASWDQQDTSLFDPTNQSLSGLFFGQLAIAVLGAMIITSEYSTGGIRTTFTASPKRLQVLVAKALVLAVAAAGLGVVICFASFFVGQAIFSTKDAAASLGDDHVLRAVLGAVLYVVGTGLFGFALGTLLRHTAGSISSAVALLLVLPPLTLALPGDWGDAVNRYFTANAGSAIATTRPQENVLGPWEGYTVFTLEWLVVLLVGMWLVQRRDA